MNNAYNDSNMIIIDRNTIYCKRGICTKFGNGDVLCDECQLAKPFEDRQKILCAGCEHRQKAMSDASSISNEDNTDNSLEYTLNRAETYAEFTPNNGEFVTIYYDGGWDYQDTLTPNSYDSGFWLVKFNKKPIIESFSEYSISEHKRSLIEKALQLLGYVKA